MGKVDLNDLKAFTIVAQRGGFAAAATAQSMSKSSLSRRVIALEEQLGVTLLVRGANAVRLTDEGTELFRVATQAFSLLEMAEQSLLSRVGGEPVGKLRIGAPSVFGEVFLGRLAADYIAEYPKVDLEIITADRELDVIEEDFDAVICVNPVFRNDLVVVQLAQGLMRLVASPKFYKSFGEVTSKSARSLPMVGVDNVPCQQPWPVSVGSRTVEITPSPVLRLSSPMMMRQAALDDAGFAILPLTLIDEDIETGRLVHIGDLQDQTILALAYPDRYVTNRLRFFIELAVAMFPGGKKQSLRRR